MRILTIIPCGQSKIWKNKPTHGPEKAEKAYTGAPFKVNREFAKKFSDKWMILSAKYGFLYPSDVIENYNVTFKNLRTNPISMNELIKQADEKELDIFELVIALGGEDYYSKVKHVFGMKANVLTPTAGLPIGVGMGRIKSLTSLKVEQMLEKLNSLG